MNYLNNNAKSKQNETKLIIEGKEFELIKYSCDLDDRWYCGELGLMIEKKVWKEGNPANKKEGEISWYGKSCGKETEQLKKLIYFGEEEVAYWKNEINKKLNETEYDIKIHDDFNARLLKAINGLEELKKLQEY